MALSSRFYELSRRITPSVPSGITNKQFSLNLKRAAEVGIPKIDALDSPPSIPRTPFSGQRGDRSTQREAPGGVPHRGFVSPPNMPTPKISSKMVSLGKAIGKTKFGKEEKTLTNMLSPISEPFRKLKKSFFNSLSS